MKLGIIGKGFVGSAVAHGFDKDCEQVIVDPKYTDNEILKIMKKSSKKLLVPPEHPLSHAIHVGIVKSYCCTLK